MPQPQPNTGFGSQKIDIGSLLQGLLSAKQINPNNIPGNQQYLQDTGQSDTPKINPATNLHDDQAAALQSVLNKNDKAQAEEAFSMKGADAVRQLLDYHYRTSPSDQSDTPINNSNTQPSSISPKQNNYGYKPDNPVSAFFNMLGFTPTPDNQLLLTQAQMNRQKLEAGQPADIAVPQAQAQELQQKIAGAEPIQPKDIADLNRQTYSATIQAANDAWQRNNDEISKMQEQYKNLQEGRGSISKTFGGQTEQMKALQNVIVEKMKANQHHLSNMTTLFNNPPKTIESQNKSQSPFQVGQQYNGETIKNVKRIK